MKKIFIIIIFFNIFATAFSQFGNENSRGYQNEGYGNHDMSNYYSFGEEFTADAWTMPYSSPDSFQIIVMAKIQYNLLNFSKLQKDNSVQEIFYCVPQLELVFKDNDGIITNRTTVLDTVFTDSYDETKSKTKYLFKSFNFVFPNGKYNLNVNFTSKDQIKKSTYNFDFDRTNGFYSKSQFSEPIYCDVKDKSVEPFVLNNCLSFKIGRAHV